MICLLAIGVALLAGCSPSQGEKEAQKRIVASKGLPSELLVVVDKGIWTSDVVDSIKALMEGAVPCLPQREDYFRMTHILTKFYKPTYSTMHSQLFLHLEPGLTGPMMGVSYDVIARPQIQVTVKAPDLNAMRRFLSSHGMQIRDLIEDHQLQMRVANLQRKHSQKISADLRQTLGMDIHAPEQIRATKKGKDFLWAGTNLNEKDQNLVIYTYPWDGSDVLTADYMAMKRDSVMRVNIPGSQPDQWMQTTREQGIPMLTSEVRPIGGRMVQEVHGLWEMRCGALGGPFVSLSRIDTARHRVIVAEGFVYSPGTPKRDLLRDLEAALRTLTVSAKN